MLLSEDKDNDFFVFTVDSRHWKLSITVGNLLHTLNMQLSTQGKMWRGPTVWGAPSLQGPLEKHGDAQNFQSWLLGKTHALGPAAALAHVPPAARRLACGRCSDIS